MSDPRLSLLDTGTRWEHYSELRELFACGIEIIKNLHYKSTVDNAKLAKLESAVELLDARINLLADYTFQTTFGSKLRATVDRDVDRIYKTLKKEAEDAAKENKPPDEDNEGPETYSNK